MVSLARWEFWGQGIFLAGRKAQEARMHNEQPVTSTQTWGQGLRKTSASIT